MVLRRYSLVVSIFLLGCSNEQTATSSSDSPELIDGEKLYMTNCAACHGGDGSLKASGSKDLQMSTLPFDSIKVVILEGRNGMPKFDGILHEDEVSAVAEHVNTLKEN